jgi:catechol 2,3-dioxygenase-like lactoylglutathione lyase family enzyme
MFSVMWIRLHSAIVHVRDFDRGREEIGRLLGQPAGWQGVDGADGAPIALFAFANTMLEVRGPAPKAPSGPGSPDASEALGREAARSARAPEAIAGESEGLCGIRLEWDLEGSEVSSRGTPKAFEHLRLGSRVPEPGRATGTGGAPDRSWQVLRVDREASRSIPLEIVSGDEGWRPAATREGDAPRGSRVDALDHVVVLSPDVEASRQLYETGLGLRLALDRSFPERGVRLLFFRVGGTTIEIGGRLDAEPRPEAGDRFGGLAWRVGDVDAARQRLVADGFDVSPTRKGHKPGTRVCTVRSPVHGVPTLLIEPAS